MCLSVEIAHPDCVLSRGEHAGHQWVTTHNGLGFRCGYVRVPRGHRWHGLDMFSIDADVHGGITFSHADVRCDGPGDDDAWWVGFDCAHAGDAPDPTLPATSPMSAALGLIDFGGVTLRDQAFVEDQCRSLCEQAAAAGTELGESTGRRRTGGLTD